MTRVHAADGSLLAEYSRERRLYLPSSAIPPLVKDAFISAEDKNFYIHRGFDPEGIVRAGARVRAGHQAHPGRLDHHPAGRQELPADLRPHRRAQDSRNPAQPAHRDRPIRRRRSSSSISTKSISASAITASPPRRSNYFDKSVHELTIAEVAYLAALPKEPSALNPFRNHDRAVERRNYVIGRMAEDGYITHEQAKAARAEPLDRQSARADARIRSPPAFSPRKCAANSPSATAKRSSTRAAFRSAPRSIPRCS